jgi:hypothetical protein
VQERKKFALLEVEVRRQFDLHCQSFERQMREKVRSSSSPSDTLQAGI